MHRRKFLRNSFKGIPFLLISPSLLTSCNDNVQPVGPNDKTVIVIGAGIAGLAAAKKLKEKGYTVTVLESQDRIGGRMRTDRSLGFAFDEGASWIHGPQGNPISDLAMKSGAKTYLTSDDSVVIYNNLGMAFNDQYITDEESAFDGALNAISQVGKQNESFKTVFNRLYPTKVNDNLWKYFLSAYLEFNTGADISNLSSRDFYDDEDFSGEDVIVTNGYDLIPQFLSQGLDIRLNNAVTKINYTNAKVSITSNGIELLADYVVITVPLGVLKNKKIEFIPELPSNKINAINNTNFGNVNKFLLVWDNPFWDVNLQYIGYTPDTKGKFNQFLNLKKFTAANALVTYTFGDYATASESLSDNEVTEEIMTHLKAIYGNAIPYPKQFKRTKWGQNKHTYGTYSCAAVGTTTEDFYIMGQQLDDKIFFGGEHTTKEYRGTVHGAYISGIREADKIIAL